MAAVSRRCTATQISCHKKHHLAVPSFSTCMRCVEKVHTSYPRLHFFCASKNYFVCAVVLPLRRPRAVDGNHLNSQKYISGKYLEKTRQSDKMKVEKSKWILDSNWKSCRKKVVTFGGPRVPVHAGWSVLSRPRWFMKRGFLYSLIGMYKK